MNYKVVNEFGFHRIRKPNSIITWNEESLRLSCVKDKLKKVGPLQKYGTL